VAGVRRIFALAGQQIAEHRAHRLDVRLRGHPAALARFPQIFLQPRQGHSQNASYNLRMSGL